MTISAAVVAADVAAAAAADDIEDDGVDDGRHDDGHASKLRQNRGFAKTLTNPMNPKKLNQKPICRCSQIPCFVSICLRGHHHAYHRRHHRPRYHRRRRQRQHQQQQRRQRQGLGDNASKLRQNRGFANIPTDRMNYEKFHQTPNLQAFSQISDFVSICLHCK